MTEDSAATLDTDAVRTWPRRLLAWIRDAPVLRARMVDANDGIVATSGLLEGFAGAGATQHTLVLAASVTTLAGALGLGGAKWAEAAAERDAQLALAAEEAGQLAANPEDEIAELADYWVGKGLTPEVASVVAEQLSAKDALAAQLEYEHGIVGLPHRGQPALEGLGAAAAFAVGALIPLLITLLVPVSIDGWVVLIAVAVSLTITSYITSLGGHIRLARVLARAMTVGLGTALLSYLLGLLLL
ncbi:VIT family protein [Humibacter soli]